MFSQVLSNGFFWVLMDNEIGFCLNIQIADIASARKSNSSMTSIDCYPFSSVSWFHLLENLILLCHDPYYY